MKVIAILFMLFGMVGATFAQTHQTAYRFLAQRSEATTSVW